MEKKEKKGTLNDYAITAVPEEEQKSFLGLFLVYTGVLVCVAVIWTGGSLGRGLDFYTLLYSILAGSIVLGVIGLLTGLIGGYTRTSTYVILRHPFGRYGSMIAGAAVSGIGCGIGWFFIQAWLFGTVLETVTTEIWGTVPFWAQAPVSAFWGAILMTLSAVFGYSGIAFLSYITVPLFLIVLGGGSFAAISEAGGFSRVLTATPADPITFSAAVTAIIGTYIAGATITPDIARYSSKPSHGGWAWFAQVIIMQPILFLAAGMLTLLTPEGDVAHAMAHLGIGLGALILIIFGQWTTNDNNLYNGALAFANTIKVKKSKITIVMGLIGAVLASLTAMGVFGADPFMNFLNQLGRYLPPIAGILIADFYIIKPFIEGVKELKERYTFGPGTKYALINWVGIISWILAGYFAPSLPGIVALNSIIISFAAYIILTYLSKLVNITVTTGEYIEQESGF